MTLPETVIKLICDKFKTELIYIGEDLRKKEKKAVKVLEDRVNVTTNLDKAEILMENNVADFCKPIVITDSMNNITSVYEHRSINKAANVSMYILRPRLYKNPYIEKNIYKLNYNPKLYKIYLQKVSPRKSKSISTLYGQYSDHRLVIVGGGASWQDIEWDKKADDIRVMIVNYNFKLKADFLIYNDKQVGRDLENIVFWDKRIIIGWEDHTSRVTDYVFSCPKDTVNVTHTGAMAIQIAEKMGFKKVYLAGFDYKKNSDGKDQVYEKLKNDYYKDSRIQRMLMDFDKFKTTRTYNVNRESKLQKLPFADKKELYAN